MPTESKATAPILSEQPESERLQALLAELQAARAATREKLADLVFEPDFSSLAALVKSLKAHQIRTARLEEELAAYDALEVAITARLAKIQAEEAEKAVSSKLKSLQSQEKKLLTMLAKELQPLERVKALADLARIRRELSQTKEVR